jgi:RNA polymerase sigma-70 factor (ECF subfamily)
MDSPNGPDLAPSKHFTTDLERQQAFLQLLEPELAPLSRFCRSMCRDDMDAQDLASETVFRAWQHFDRLEAPRAFLSFLLTIAHREGGRNRKRRSIWTPIGSLTNRELIDNESSPDGSADLHNLQLALQKLPEKHREAVVLAEIVGLKLEEVAEIQGSSLTAVKSRVSRAKRKLAKLLGVEEYRRLESPAVQTRTPATSRPDVHPRVAFFSKEKLL